MFDIFLTEDINALLKNKHVVFMGDSNVRALYKDFLCLSSETVLISNKILRTKMEKSVYGDSLVRHGDRTNGRDYHEDRKGRIKSTDFSFYFLTRVYNKCTEVILKEVTRNQTGPDVIVINSCLWDVSRWGPKGVDEYKANMRELMKRFKALLPAHCLVIWLTAPPISQEMKGGFLVKELDFLKYSLRFHVMEANHFARKVFKAHGYDVLDVHYHLKMQICKRAIDGIHWLPPAVRYVSNLLLSHISLAWGVDLPHRYQPIISAELLGVSDDDATESTGTSGENEEPSKQPTEGRKPNEKPSSKQSLPVASKKGSVAPPKNSFRDESCHAFMSRQKKKQRKNRIKAWRCKPTPVNCSAKHPYSPCEPPLQNYYPEQRPYPLCEPPPVNCSPVLHPCLPFVFNAPAYPQMQQSPYRFPESPRMPLPFLSPRPPLLQRPHLPPAENDFASVDCVPFGQFF